MKQLEGKCAVVTGGSSGIGLGVVSACAAAGMQVVIADIEAERGAQAAERVGPLAWSWPTDVSDPASTDALAAAVQDRYGAAHLVVCNAGVIATRPFVEATDDDWSFVLGVNLLGAIHTLRSFLPAMMAQEGERHVVTVSSIAGLRASSLGGRTLYSTSKYAVFGLSESLAPELEECGIGLTVVFPGPVATDIHAGSQRRRPGSLGGGIIPDLATTGMTPARAGEIVLDGVRNDRRYVVTHPELWPDVEEGQRRLAAAFGVTR